ncbi:MAG: hydroxyacid-oxoacid transhydrogenase [Acidiferrobacterales bacterium]
MGCCQYFTPTDGGADAFTVEMPRLTFGRGVLNEVGERARACGIGHAAIFTDPYLADSEHLAQARASLDAAGIDYGVYSEVRIEPTDRSVLAAADFLKDGNFDGVVSVGGGSVIDTAKGGMVYALYPSSFSTYFPPPAGDGQPVPGRVLPHLACPTTSGTGSEVTGLSVILFESLHTKFVLGSRYILPDEAIIDPACTATLPSMVVASSGLDLLSHAIECYTARAYTRWAKVAAPGARPMIQGANPWSDLHAREALRIVGEYLERGVTDASDHEARDNLSWAASLAGMAFGNCGTHLPHALSYAVSQGARDFQAKGYPAQPSFVPHGISVIVNSPSVFRYTAQTAPERHLEAAQCLGADTRDAVPADAGEVVAARIISLMRATGIPNGIGGVGLTREDASELAQSAIRQRRAIGNAPRDTGLAEITQIFEGAVKYW